MAETYFPFDAGAGSSATEDQWRKMAKFWTRSGVYRGELNALAPTANGSGMQVFVDTGRAWVEGHFYENDASKTLAIAAADPTNPRIDRIVLKLDTAGNTIGLAIKTGTPAGSPTPPVRVWGSTVFELPIAQVLVDAAATNIAAPKITDERAYASQGPALDRIDFRSAADAVADVDLRRTGAGAAQLTGAFTVSGTLHSVGAATLDSTLNVGGKVTITAGGLDVSGSSSGYNDEVRFTTAGAGASVGLSSMSSGGPAMVFDHRASGNTGAWYWRNGTNAGNNRMILSATGELTIAGGGIIVSGSPTGYNDEIRFNTGGAGAISALSSLSTGSPEMAFHHRGASNTGSWTWRNGSNAGNLAMQLSGTAVLTVSGGAVVSAGGVDFAGSISGYSGGELRSTTTGSVSSALSTMQTGSGVLAFDHRGTSNTGTWRWNNGSGAAANRMSLSATGDLATGGKVSATVVSNVAFIDSDLHSWEVDGAGGWNFANRWGITNAIFRFFGGASTNELAQLKDGVGALDTSLYLRWGNNVGTVTLRPVTLVQGANMKINNYSDNDYFLKLA